MEFTNRVHPAASSIPYLNSGMDIPMEIRALAAITGSIDNRKGPGESKAFSPAAEILNFIIFVIITYRGKTPVSRRIEERLYYDTLEPRRR